MIALYDYAIKNGAAPLSAKWSSGIYFFNTAVFVIAFS